MTWTDTSANTELWGELARGGEINALDEFSAILLDEIGNELIVGVVDPWSNTPANSETWVDV